jgi:hypothetical protein
MPGPSNTEGLEAAARWRSVRPDRIRLDPLAALALLLVAAAAVAALAGVLDPALAGIIFNGID